MNDEHRLLIAVDNRKEFEEVKAYLLQRKYNVNSEIAVKEYPLCFIICGLDKRGCIVRLNVARTAIHSYDLHNWSKSLKPILNGDRSLEMYTYKVLTKYGLLDALLYENIYRII